MVDFNKFNKMINKEELQKQMNSAPEYDDVPKGTYICDIEKMEIKETKKQDKRKLFWNRKIAGNKTTEKWNDGAAIKGVISWIEKLLDEDDTIEFKNYSQFADEVLDIYQDICPQVAVKVNYDPDAFNPISIIEVFDK